MSMRRKPRANKLDPKRQEFVFDSEVKEAPKPKPVSRRKPKD